MNAVSKDDLVRAILRHRWMILQYVRSIVGHLVDAEDVYQEVVIVALRKRDRLENLDALGPWLRKAARYEAFNALRAASKSNPLGQEAMDVVDQAWDARAAADAEQPYSEALKQCFDGLPEHYRDLISLKFEENLSGAQLSRVVGKPLNTVYVSLSRAYVRLRECVHRRLELGQ